MEKLNFLMVLDFLRDDVVAGYLMLRIWIIQSWPKKCVLCRLRDSACWRSGEITQPRTNFFGQLCTWRTWTRKFISSLRSRSRRRRRSAPNIGKFAKALMARKESRIDIGGGSELWIGPRGTDSHYLRVLMLNVNWSLNALFLLSFNARPTKIHSGKWQGRSHNL